MPRSNGMRTAPSDVSKSQRSPLAVVIGAFPPPRHGQAVSNEAVVHRLQAAGWLVSEVDTSPGLLVRSFTYYARRAATGGRARLIIICWGLIAVKTDSFKICS